MIDWTTDPFLLVEWDRDLFTGEPSGLVSLSLAVVGAKRTWSGDYQAVTAERAAGVVWLQLFSRWLHGRELPDWTRETL